MDVNWIDSKLGELITHQKGFAFKSKWYQNTGRMIVRVSDTTHNSINISTCNRLDPKLAENHANVELEFNDVVIATVGSWPPNYNSVVGKVIRVPKQASGSLLNQNAVRLRVISSNITSQAFIYYLLKSRVFQSYIINCAQGSASQASIKLTDIFSYNFKIPPLPEQKAIASILSALDDKIELNLQMNKTLEDMAMALYKHWFVDFGPFQDGKFVDSELGMIPEGWEVKRLDDLLDIKYGKDHKKLKEGNIPCYGTGGIMRYVETALYDKESILIPRKGSLNNLYYLSKPFWTVDTLFYSKIKEPVFGKYTFYFLKSLDLASMDVGSAVPSLTSQLLKRINIIYPPEHLVSKFNDDVSLFFNQIEHNKLGNETLTKLRNTLLPKLISGEVRLKEFQETIAEVL